MQDYKIAQVEDDSTSKHSNIQEVYSETDEEFKSEYRWLDAKKNEWEIARDYIYCPNCESTGKNIIKNGISPTNKQKFKCKICNLQFVGSINSIIRRYDFYELFIDECMKKPDKYNSKYIGAAWTYLSTRKGERYIKNLVDRQFQGMIKDKKDFETFMYLLIEEAYCAVTR
jgi:transposase-like protein